LVSLQVTKRVKRDRGFGGRELEVEISWGS
jgi:hypothetical protein